MKNIVTIENSNLIVTLNDVVFYSGNKYESIRRLMIDNRNEFEELGVEFKTKRNINVDFKSMKLNEEQTTFLMILMRNNPIVVKFKFNLVKQFMALKDMVCETNRLKLDLVRKDLKQAQSNKRKTYKDGFMSLSKYLSDNEIILNQDEAFGILYAKDLIGFKEVPTIRRVLLDETLGRQDNFGVIEFNSRALDGIFAEYISRQPTLF